MRRKKVLLIDDSVSSCGQTIELLSQMGYDTVATHTLGEAVCHLQEQQFDIILADLWADGGAGEHLLTWMRAEQREEPVVMMAVDADYDLLSEMIDKGAIDLMSKPLQLAQLKRSLDLAQGVHLLTA